MTAATGTRDTHYDLVSVLYHILQEADTLQQYIDDARNSGETDTAQFFTDIQTQDRLRAERAKQLLQERLSR